MTTTPAKDLTDENLARYDVFLLNYFETPKGEPDTKWSDANKAAFLKAIRDDGKGLVAYHFASAAFTKPNWPDFEKAVAGGWRTQGYHGPMHEFTVKKTAVKHPISDGLPTQFNHVSDELYSASMRTRGSVVLATAYCDPAKPMGTGMDEAVVWVNQFGKGRVVENVLGHDAKALSDKPVQEWFKRCVEWAATGKVGSPSRPAGTRPNCLDPHPFVGYRTPGPMNGHPAGRFGVTPPSRRGARRCLRRDNATTAGRGSRSTPSIGLSNGSGPSPTKPSWPSAQRWHARGGSVAILATVPWPFWPSIGGGRHGGRRPGVGLSDRPHLEPVSPPPRRIRPTRRSPQVGTLPATAHRNPEPEPEPDGSP